MSAPPAHRAVALRALPIRTWLALALLAIVALPLAVTWGVTQIGQAWSLTAAREALIADIQANAARWADPD